MFLQSTLTRIGVLKGTLILSTFCVLFSSVIYLAIGFIAGVYVPFGFVISLVTPALVAPPVCIVIIRIALSLYRVREELLRARQDLEEKVAIRTEDLTRANDQLKEEIEERKEAERRLRDSESRFRELTENSLSGIYIIQDGVYRYVNPAMAAILGYLPEELTLMEPSAVVVREDLPLVDENIGKGFEGRQEGMQYVFRVVRKDGKTILLEVLETLIAYDGHPALIGNALDITERRESEEVLRRSEARYRTLLESIMDGVYMLDEEGRYTYVNDIIIQRSGRPGEWFMGRHFLDNVLPEFKEIARKSFEADMRGEVGPPFEVVFAYGGQSTEDRLWVEVNRKPLYDGERITGVLGTSRDITLRKQMEAELLRARTLESIGTLAAGIAHDFNNLLMSLAGYISLARFAISPDHEGFQFLGEAERVALAGRKLTDRLITFSEGGTPIRREIGLEEVIKDSASMALAGSNVHCVYSLTGDRFPVGADETQIRQVIHNVVMNAKEAMPSGGTIRICTENRVIAAENGLPVPAGNYVRISIEDQGAGIKVEDLPRVFDPYFTTKGMGASRGMGLGLTTAYSIMKRHRGHITVESMPDRGAVVCLYLPALGGDKAVDHWLESAANGAKGRILFMDDDDKVRDVGCKLLGYLGHEVIPAGDGGEAVDLYKKALRSEAPFDAVILDLTVKGGMGGKEAFNQMRSLDPGVKGIVSSGYTDDPIISRYEEYGFKGAITKPYKADDLRVLLLRVIGMGK
jgi:PAS domain S-box-containing protein